MRVIIIYILLIFPFLLGTTFNHLKHAWGSRDPVLTTIGLEYGKSNMVNLRVMANLGVQLIINKHKRLR